MAKHDETKLAVKLKVALAALPERQRIVFFAIRHEEIGYAELAQRLGSTIGAVEQAFADALVALADAADE